MLDQSVVFEERWTQGPHRWERPTGPALKELEKGNESRVSTVRVQNQPASVSHMHVHTISLYSVQQSILINIASPSRVGKSSWIHCLILWSTTGSHLTVCRAQKSITPLDFQISHCALLTGDWTVVVCESANKLDFRVICFCRSECCIGNIIIQWGRSYLNKSYLHKRMSKIT